MKLIRKISALVIVLCIIVANNNYSYALTEKEVLTEKADILQELQILKGNGVSLDLDSQLSRSQAAAFIVRLLCEEDEVIDNKLKYITSKFSDVKKDQWFAPYVGYCVEKGIIDGYPGNIFKPDDKLSEKAFLKLVLIALGYEYNDDFTWNNVFEYAYGVKLVKSLDYVSGYVEKEVYNRGEVVRVLHTALQLVNPDSKVRMIQNFIDNNVITKEKAEEYKLIDDEIETEVKSVKPVNATTIEVKFNENVQGFEKENLLIYESNDTSVVLPISDVTTADSSDTYTIVTSEKQKMDKEYTLLVDKVIDTKGNPSTSFSKEFLGFRADEVESDYFMISKVEPISNNVIYVYFTQPINENAVQAAFYSVKKDDQEVLKGDNLNLLVNKLATCDNGISIYFKNYVFTEKEYFELVIDGNLSSKFGVRLNDGNGDSVKFKSSMNNNVPFTLDSCLPINSHTIQLIFNKAVNPERSEQIFNYYIKDTNNNPLRVSKAIVMNEGDYAGKVVRLTMESPIQVNKQYDVLINYMQDISRQFEIIGQHYSFVADYYSVKDLKIEAVLPIDENLVLLYIDKAVDQDSAEIVSNYRIRGISNSNYLAIPTAVYYNKFEDPQIIKIYLSDKDKLKPSEVYRFTVQKTLKDEMGNFLSSSKTKEFTQSSSESNATTISEATIIGDNTVKLEFSREIAFDINNILTSNYTLTYTENGLPYNKIPIGVNYVDPSTITLKFDFLDSEKDYKITFKKLIDYGKNETTNLNNEYITDVEVGE